MGKVLYTDFEDVKTVIETMMDSSQLKKAVTRTNLYKFWDSILPSKLKGLSRPFGMMSNGTLMVACKNPVVAQELSLHKVILFSKFMPYAKSMKLILKDIKFDARRWQEETIDV